MELFFLLNPFCFQFTATADQTVEPKDGKFLLFLDCSFETIKQKLSFHSSFAWLHWMNLWLEISRECEMLIWIVIVKRDVQVWWARSNHSFRQGMKLNLLAWIPCIIFWFSVKVSKFGFDCEARRPRTPDNKLTRRRFVQFMEQHFQCSRRIFLASSQNL